MCVWEEPRKGGQKHTHGEKEEEFLHGGNVCRKRYVERNALLRGQTHHHKAHLAHGLLVVVVHLAHQGVAEVDRDPLDGLVLPRGVQDVQEQFVDAAVLELQLFRDAEVAQGEAAVPLHLEVKGEGVARRRDRTRCTARPLAPSGITHTHTHTGNPAGPPYPRASVSTDAGAVLTVTSW